MKHLARTVVSVFAAVCGVGGLEAHEVVWFQNAQGTNPAAPMVLYFGRDWCGDKDWGEIGIVPSIGEPCTVVVNLTSVSSPAISAHFENGINTGREVWIEVDVEGLGPGIVNATVSGEWHATGSPNPLECDATNPNPFTVNVVVKSPIWWTIMRGLNPGTIHIDTGNELSGLRWANTLNGPWINVGVGTKFTLDTDMNQQFFKGTRHLGGPFTGTVNDPAGNPLTGITLGLPYGGPATSTGYGGYFEFSWLPRGMNLIAIGKPITFTDPGTGSNQTENVAVNVVVPATTNHLSDLGSEWMVDMAAGSGPGPVTNNCYCTPWCAIGFGTLNGAQTPVYYAGGAIPTASGSADCDPPEVIVTPPSGAAYSITPGANRHQNSGPTPASGTWTVTTTVCGRSKSCAVTVP